MHRPNIAEPYTITKKTTEYILDPESFTLFKIISSNVFAQWNTSCTIDIRPNEEFQLDNSMFITPYIGKN